jgi:hypothetical protein
VYCVSFYRQDGFGVEFLKEILYSGIRSLGNGGEERAKNKNKEEGITGDPQQSHCNSGSLIRRR